MKEIKCTMICKIYFKASKGWNNKNTLWYGIIFYQDVNVSC